MDSHQNPIQGKSLASKPKIVRKPSDAPKINSREPSIFREKRVFGTARNTKVPVKPAVEKPTLKASIGVLRKQPKSTLPTRSGADKPAVGSTEKKSSEKQVPRLKKSAEPKEKVAEKSPSFSEKKSSEKPVPSLKKKNNEPKEKVAEKSPRNLRVQSVVEPRTPVALPLPKPKISATPYHTAVKCSKCRFDKLETSSYWISQIKLAESVGKHFVSAAFFRLAQESNAEPIRTLRIELKRYLMRHEHLSVHKEWKDVRIGYGLLEDDGTGEGNNAFTGGDPESTNEKHHHEAEILVDQQDKYVTELNQSPPVAER